MALYAFDGTGNEDNISDGKDTNVRKFFEAYQGAYDKNGVCLYIEGVGTRKGFAGKIFGSIFGAGGEERIEEAIDKLEDNFDKGDEQIDIIGFSRGAALALEFANDIQDHGVNGKTPTINFLGIWDTVASFGIPGNNINLGYTLSIPQNVKHCSHAISLDERRQGFPLTRVTQNSYTNIQPIEIHEVWFRGFHSDVGGGNYNESLSSISLVWMFHQARRNNITIPDNHMEKHEGFRNPNSACNKPGMDIVPNKKRIINHNDMVHESVSRRDWAARRFKANNPPKGLKVMGDDGRLKTHGFEEA